jgi:FKBP-type peptidyl-prolyl cis-trans isomerase FkpA
MKLISSVIGIMLLSTLVLFSACKKEQESVNYSTIDKAKIQEYIKAHNWDADSTSNGLYYVVTKTGVGQNPSLYSNVKIRYKGYLLSGKIFDEAKSPAVLNLSQVIKGWQEGVPKFKEGGEGILLIPSGLGYGGQAQNSIPANSVLIFEIKLDEVL